MSRVPQYFPVVLFVSISLAKKIYSKFEKKELLYELLDDEAKGYLLEVIARSEYFFAAP